MSDSDDRQLRQRLVWNRRYRKRTRDQTFSRRQSSSSSDSEPEPAKRTCSSESPASNFEGNSEAEVRSDDQPSPASSHIEGPVSDRGEGEGEDQEIREVAEEEEEHGEQEDCGDGGGFSGSGSGSEGPASDEGEGEGEDQGIREVAEEEEEGGRDSSEQEDNGDGDGDGDESDTEYDDEDEGFDINDNQPLYDGAQITLKQSALSILSFVLCHKLSGACTNDLLTLISLHCGQNNLCLKSSYLFKKYFSVLGKDNVTRHYYCSVCETPVPSKDSHCGSCSAQDDASENEINIDDPIENERTYEIQYFLEFSLTKQLQSMYLRPGFLESLQFKFNRVKKNFNNIEDIYDGQIYIELEQEGFLSNPNNISFTMYFDGVSIYKSSKFSVWPIFFSINELKYKERSKKENVIIAGLWFGKKKPNPNLFLRPVWDKLQILQNQGVELKLPNAHFIIVKGRVVSAVGDLPAKALFMRLIQYNGAFSCFNCLSSGARYETGPRSSVQVFPYIRNFIMRSNAEMVDFANQAVIARAIDRDANVYGVKGPTLLSAFLPDLVRCMGIDDLHGLFSGQMKALLDFWFNSPGPYSISALVDLVDDRLKKIKPPFHFQRVPRSIKQELGMFKGSDYKIMFFFFSVPLLYGILPDEFWEHHCKLVSAVSLLSQDSVSPQHIQTADELLHIYVRDFQHLYGIRYLGLNVHQLLHLSMVVKNLGPLFVYSCFTYESLNGQLSNLVHGTRHAALQICSSSYVCLNLPVMISKLEDCEAKRLCLKFMESGKKKVKLSEVVDHETYIVDKCKLRNRVPQFIRRLLRDDLNIEGGRVKFFLRLKKKGNVYCSEDYVRSQRKLSCYVEIFHNDIPHLCKIKFLIRWSSCDLNCPPNCVQCPKRVVSIVETYNRIPWRLQELGQNITIPHLNKVSASGVLSAFPVGSFRNACLYMSFNDDEYICTPVNSLEVE